MTIPEQRLKRRLASIYHLSPVLWAVVKGHADEEAIARRLGKPQQGVRRGIEEAIYAGILTREEGKLMPNLPRHRSLYNELHPQIPIIRYASHPILKLLGDRVMTTTDIAGGINRPYHSTYKSLQRLQANDLVTRVDKLWRKVE